MKRYKDSKKLIILNIIFEYFLIIIVYLLCGLIRIQIEPPYGEIFHMDTLMKYFPASLAVGMVMIAIFFIMGDYNSIHFRSKKRIIVEAILASIVGGVSFSALLFVVADVQFSRILLVMLMVSWSIVVSLKRLIFEHLADKVFADKITSTNVLILGSGDTARRYFEKLQSDSSSRYRYCGYLADRESIVLPTYMGGYAQFYDVVTSEHIGKVVITEESPSRKFFNDILSVCSMFSIEAIVIPSYADYIFESQKVQIDNDMHALSLSAFDTSDILGVNISVTDMEKTISDIRDNMDKWSGKYICVSNVHTTVMAHDNPEYLKVQNGAVMALPDGGPLSSYSRSEGKKDAKRVTGPDLMKEILKRSGEYGWKHFFYGSTDKTLAMLKDKIEKDYPGAQIVGMISPPYRELTAGEDQKYTDMINVAKPDFIWVGLGAPKQEIWMSAHEDRVHGIMIGVGAAFDYESGNLKRAPKWMQNHNLEWFYRFAQEPKRLFKRYIVTNAKFLWLTRR